MEYERGLNSVHDMTDIEVKYEHTGRFKNLKPLDPSKRKKLDFKRTDMKYKDILPTTIVE